MEHVGLTEKLRIRREGNSMRQWKRRQRDWQRVSEEVAAKTGKASALHRSNPAHHTPCLSLWSRRKTRAVCAVFAEDAWVCLTQKQHQE